MEGSAPQERPTQATEVVVDASWLNVPVVAPWFMDWRTRKRVQDIIDNTVRRLRQGDTVRSGRERSRE